VSSSRLASLPLRTSTGEPAISLEGAKGRQIGSHPLANGDRSEHRSAIDRVLLVSLIEITCSAATERISAEIAIARSGRSRTRVPVAGENRITKRGDERRYSRLSDAGGRRRALRDVDVRLSRNLVDPGHGVIIEIGLLDNTVLAVISPLRTMLVPKTTAPSNCARVASGLTTSPASTAVSTRGMRISPSSLTSTSTTVPHSQETAMGSESKP